MTTEQDLDSESEKKKSHYERFFRAFVPMAVERFKISEEQAELRVEALLQSGILSRMGNPTHLHYRLAVDVALQIPQRSASSASKESQKLPEYERWGSSNTVCAIIYRKAGLQVTRKCPFCGNRHIHGTIQGHRIAHCQDQKKEIVASDGTILNSGNGYIIKNI